jgi:hypothetical protein
MMRNLYLIVAASLLLVSLVVGCGKSRQEETQGIWYRPSEHAGTVYEMIEFTEAEKASITELIEKLPQEVRQQFDTKYEAWKATWDAPSLAFRSDPRAWALSEQYEQLLQFCQEQGKAVWPLIFERLQQDRCFIVSNLLGDLTLEKYGYILDEIRKESQQERYTKEGEYIAPSAEANWVKYAKELLALL